MIEFIIFGYEIPETGTEICSANKSTTDWNNYCDQVSSIRTTEVKLSSRFYNQKQIEDTEKEKINAIYERSLNAVRTQIKFSITFPRERSYMISINEGRKKVKIIKFNEIHTAFKSIRVNKLHFIH